jgi:hypothetical protein
VKWTAELFGPVTSKLNANGKPLGQVTYPRFLISPEDKLQLFRRLGGCGNAELMLYEYDGATGRWTTLGAVTTRKGDYHGSGSRNAYINGADYDRQGRLHLTWCWRESGDPMTNHDICYAYSDDRGRTWFNNAGKPVGETGKTPMRFDTPGVTVWEIGRNRGLINQTCQAVDSKGCVHVVTWHVPPDEPRAKSWKDANQRRRYYHYWRDTEGEWHQQPIDPKVVGAGSRPKMLFDDQDNLYVVFSVSVAAATGAKGWKDWAVAFAEPGEFLSQPLIDVYRWREEGVLSIYAQRKGDKPGQPSALCVFDLKKH